LTEAHAAASAAARRPSALQTEAVVDHPPRVFFPYWPFQQSCAAHQTNDVARPAAGNGQIRAGIIIIYSSIDSGDERRYSSLRLDVPRFANASEAWIIAAVVHQLCGLA